jgi:hypothetical protein
MVVVGMLVAEQGAGEAPSPPSPIRTELRDLAQLAARTYEQSATFRDLVATLKSTDVVVYLTYGECAEDANACLRFVSKAGPHRYLLVKLDPFRSPFEQPGLLAHELQHAVDIGQDAQIVDRPSFFRFVARNKEPSPPNSEMMARHVAREVDREVLARTK